MVDNSPQSRTPGDATPVLRLEGVSKSFGQTRALRNVSMAVKPASVHGLVGGNGAGKSTIMKILSGVHQPDEGTIIYRGAERHWSSPSAANQAGIGTAHQHIELANDLNALENVFLGEPGWRRHDPELRTRYRQLCERLGASIPPEANVGELPIAQRQLVTIMRALASKEEPALVILDEPTAPLSARERDSLFATIRQLAESGIAVIFCSHFLDEILDITDEITVLRDGEVVTTLPTSEVEHDHLVELIVGKKMFAAETRADRPDHAVGDEVLQVRDLVLYDGAAPSNFAVRRGEIVGIAGLVGSGRSCLLHTIFGRLQPERGTILFKGEERPFGPQNTVRAGLGLVPEDRNAQALMSEWEIWRNISLPYLERFAKWGWLTDTAREREAADQAIADLSIRTPSAEALVSHLSGGNAQKVVLSKWICGDPDLLLLDDPMVGVDIAAKADILENVQALAAKGCAVIVTSSEFDELLGFCDRILLQFRGAITGERDNRNLTKADLVALVSGIATADEHKETDDVA